jgi:membrane protein required for beta-lactamase induction
MTFIVILGSLIAERYLLGYQYLRHAVWFERWLELHQSLPFSAGLREGRIGLLGILAVPLLVLVFAQWLVYGAFAGVIDILFAALVLLYSLGPRDLDRQVSELAEAAAAKDRTRGASITAELLSEQARSSTRRVAEGVLAAALRRIFAVLFWFSVLGPLGALAYRLTRETRRLAREQTRPGLEPACEYLLFLLDWIPARMLAGLFALAGCFESAIEHWHDCDVGGNADAGAALVACTGSGALQLADGLSAESEPNAIAARAAMRLVWRALVIFLALLGLSTVSGWLL